MQKKKHFYTGKRGAAKREFFNILIPRNFNFKFREKLFINYFKKIAQNVDKYIRID